MPTPLASPPRTRRSSGSTPTRGDYVIWWIEEHLVHGPGDFYGQPFHLEEDQKRFIRRAYEQLPNGRRRYRRVLKGIARGGGKTELAAAIAVAELGAGLHPSPDIPVAAASFEQADQLFSSARIMVSEGKLRNYFHVFETEILVKDGPGRLYRVAAVAGTNEGGRPTFFVADEVHAWEGNKERVHLVLSTGLSKRSDGWELDISTAGHDKETLLGRLYDHGRKVEGGEVDDPAFLMDWTEADPAKFNLEDPADRERAVRTAYPNADKFWPIENVLRRFHEMPRNEWIRYHLNAWTETAEIWEVATLWDGLTSPLQLDPMLPVFVGVDVGVKHDSSAVVLAQPQGDRIVLRAEIWENPYPVGGPQHDTWRFSIATVENHLRDLFDRYPKVARERSGPAFFYDPHFFEAPAQILAGDGLNMIEYPQQDARMVPASQRFFELAKTGVLAHDGNVALRRHIRNVVAEERSRGWRISKLKARKHIDAAVAAAIASYEASRQQEEAPQPEIHTFTEEELLVAARASDDLS